MTGMAEKGKGWFRGALDKIEAQVDTKKAEFEEGVARAGNVTIEKTFGTTLIAIYDGGYVRLSKVLNSMTPMTPYEKLKSITYREQVQDRGRAERAWQGPLSSKQKRTVYLTVATDRKVHTLSAEASMLSPNDKTGMALEAAGQAVLSDAGSAAAPAAPPASAGVSDVPDQIKKLADLHAAGVLTDEEFNAKKAELLGRM